MFALSISEADFTLTRVARRYRTGVLSPVDVLEECLRRIEQFEPDVQAWVRLDPQAARAEAREAAARFALGEEPGSLAGIPVGIKDLIDVAGAPTLAGSPIRAGHLATEDAPAVASLRRAGAILLGKTVTTEFACFDPPPTRNPWNLDRTPGGSSSGSCAAVALGMCLGALGTQTGGSINRPASFCGVAGFKPSFHAISTRGVVPLAYSLDHVGPIARRVEDLEALFRALRRDAPAQSASSPPADFDFHPLATAPTLCVDEPFVADADPEMRAAFETARRLLVQAGATLEIRRLPAEFAEVHRMHRRIFVAEAACEHRPAYLARPADFGCAIRGCFEEGFALSAVDLVEARKHRTRLMSQLMVEGPKLWLFPAALGAAPGRETTGDPRFNSPWSYLGAPSVNFPMALSAEGMPLGIQLVHTSVVEDDPLLLQTARWCESVLHPARTVPPRLG